MKRSTVSGGKAIAKRFRPITPGLTVPINLASRKAMRPMLNAAKANAPRRTGLLKRALIIKNRKGRTLVGPDKSVTGARGAKPVKYAHIDEFGRAPRASGKGGQPGTRFLTRAFDATKDLVLRTFAAELGPAIDDRVKKLAAKANL